MTKSPSGQLSLDCLFDTTAISSGLTIGGGCAAPPDVEDDDEAAPAPTFRLPPRNWRLVGDRDLAASWKGRAADNLAAIRLLRQLTDEDRAATAEEQARLAKFVAFSASELSQTMFRRAGEGFRPGWESLGGELEQLVGAQEMAGLARATQYAHYTPEYIVRALWTCLDRMGFAGGNVLEPGCGTGLFLAAMPEKAAVEAVLTGIEADPITAGIAKRLFPNAWIRQEDFIKARLTERYDLVIGNPPFSDRTVRSTDAAGKLGLSLHDYFIARSIERLRPGGIAAFVTSRWTMDKQATTARAHIAGLAELIGAVRLPQGAMKADAGTEVVVDVLLFRRHHPGQESTGPAWLDVAELPECDDGEGRLSVNEYFHQYPEMVLGTHAWTSSPYGPTYTCRPSDTLDLPSALSTALTVLSAGVRMPAPEPATAVSKARRLHVGTAAEGATVKEGSYVLLDGMLHQVVDSVPVIVAVKSATCKDGIFAKHARIVQMLLPIRDAVRGVLRAQEANEPWGTLQARLRTAYLTFVRSFGPINLAIISSRTDEATGEVSETVRRPNLQPFTDDPDCWLVASIEEYDVESGTAQQGPIFSQRVIHPPVEPVITSAADALAVTLHEVGHVDVARVGELLGRSREETLAELGEAVFLDPAVTLEGLEAWDTADAYLSGPVRTKLAVAEAAAGTDARYARNVSALRRVKPEDLRPSDITARLGAPWIPADAVDGSRPR